MPSRSVVLAVLVGILSFLSQSSAEIKTLTISDDSRPMILFEKFGFTHTGHVTVSISAVSVVSPLATPNPSRLGFFLVSEESLLQVLFEMQQSAQFCVLNSQFIQNLFSFRDLSPPPHASFNQSYPVTVPNEYSLFFANCNPESRVSMNVRTELYNLGVDGSKEYLSGGLPSLPKTYSLFSSGIPYYSSG